MTDPIIGVGAAAARAPRLACIIGEYCHDHGFIHGAEAEELRKRVETILADVDHEGDDAAEALDRALRIMLDEVDARDSLAYLDRTAARAPRLEQQRYENAQCITCGRDLDAPATQAEAEAARAPRLEQLEARIAELQARLEDDWYEVRDSRGVAVARFVTRALAEDVRARPRRRRHCPCGRPRPTGAPGAVDG
jgi:polyhydroxyalkanoate synthesis regulator phasin